MTPGAETGTYIVSGASGALGPHLVRALLELSRPGDRIVALARSNLSADRLLSRLPGCAPGRVSVVPYDLHDSTGVAEAARAVAATGPVVAVHAAADVGWGKSWDQLFPTNVTGTLNMARLTSLASEHASIVYVGTAYTHLRATEFRNEYERSKARAEGELREQFPALDTTTFSCSLIMGDRQNGEISRFNGIYPLLKLAALNNPPFLIGDSKAAMDLTPVDWVASELAQLAIRKMAGEPVSDVFATAGEAAMPLEEVVALAEAEIALLRAEVGLPYVHPTPMISSRRFAFLRRSVSTWQPEGTIVKDMRRWERLQTLVASYSHYLEGGRARPPANVREPPPDPSTFVAKAFRYWVEDQGPSLASSLLASRRAAG